MKIKKANAVQLTTADHDRLDALVDRFYELDDEVQGYDDHEDWDEFNGVVDDMEEIVGLDRTPLYSVVLEKALALLGRDE